MISRIEQLSRHLNPYTPGHGTMTRSYKIKGI